MKKQDNILLVQAEEPHFNHFLNNNLMSSCDNWQGNDPFTQTLMKSKYYSKWCSPLKQKINHQGNRPVSSQSGQNIGQVKMNEGYLLFRPPLEDTSKLLTPAKRSVQVIKQIFEKKQKLHASFAQTRRNTSTQYIDPNNARGRSNILLHRMTFHESNDLIENNSVNQAQEKKEKSLILRGKSVYSYKSDYEIEKIKQFDAFDEEKKSQLNNPPPEFQASEQTFPNLIMEDQNRSSNCQENFYLQVRQERYENSYACQQQQNMNSLYAKQACENQFEVFNSDLTGDQNLQLTENSIYQEKQSNLIENQSHNMQNEFNIVQLKPGHSNYTMKDQSFPERQFEDSQMRMRTEENYGTCSSSSQNKNSEFYHFKKYQNEQVFDESLDKLQIMVNKSKSSNKNRLIRPKNEKDNVQYNFERTIGSSAAKKRESNFLIDWINAHKVTKPIHALHSKDDLQKKQKSVSLNINNQKFNFIKNASMQLQQNMDGAGNQNKQYPNLEIIPLDKQPLSNSIRCQSAVGDNRVKFYHKKKRSSYGEFQNNFPILYSNNFEEEGARINPKGSTKEITQQYKDNSDRELDRMYDKASDQAKICEEGVIKLFKQLGIPTSSKGRMNTFS